MVLGGKVGAPLSILNLVQDDAELGIGCRTEISPLVLISLAAAGDAAGAAIFDLAGRFAHDRDVA